MEIIRLVDLAFIAASHEDPNNPGALKKIPFPKDKLSGDRFELFQFARIYPGNSFQKHYHEDMDEIFYILNGRGKIVVGEEEAIVEVGDALLIPMKVTHELHNIGSGVLDYLVVGVSQGRGGKTIVV